ncbi:MAG: hypothetical protein M0Z51_16820 [Propionibacterium sp.]|nr:hypothetical protein [Propionibacterium sp.]
MSIRLDPSARERLRTSHIPVAAFARFNGWADGVWHGDRCGCTDDRCTDGYHHEAHEDCGCLPVLIDAYLEGG